MVVPEISQGNAEASQLPVPGKLVLRHLPSQIENAPKLLLIHGWGVGSVVWDAVTDKILGSFSVWLLDMPGYGVNRDVDCTSIIELARAYSAIISCQIPGNFYICGWSLGGALASLIAKEMPARISGLVTIATNPLFISQENWPSAMPATDFEAFAARLAGNPAKQLDRFLALQTSGVDTTITDVRALRSLVKGEVIPDTEILQNGLHWLQATDLRDCWNSLTIPVMHQYGTYDPLVPAAVAVDVKKCFPSHELVHFESSAHLPFLSEPDAWLASLVRFSRSQQARNVISRQAIAESFSRAASQYDAAAKIQHRIGTQLMGRLPEELSAGIIDLGSGTGSFTSKLCELYPDCPAVAMDIASGMLGYSNGRVPTAAHVQADIEQLPFGAKNFALAFSSLSLQWCRNLPAVFRDLYRVMMPGGIVVASTLVDGSLWQLKQAWGEVDDATHVNYFEEEGFLVHCCEDAGFTIAEWQVQDEIDCFDTAAELLHSVKDIGAHNLQSQRSPGLLGKRRFMQFARGLEKSRDNTGKLNLSYKVLYMKLVREQ